MIGSDPLVEKMLVYTQKLEPRVSTTEHCHGLSGFEMEIIHISNLMIRESTLDWKQKSHERNHVQKKIGPPSLNN